MQKAGLEADVARLERLRAAHIDDQHAVRRHICDAERDLDVSMQRIAEISQDMERLVPTSGDAFAMIVAGKHFTERKGAGGALMKEIGTLVQLQHQGEAVIASIGGFDLEDAGEHFGRDGYRFATTLLRTNAGHEVGLPVTITPLGAIARLEHALGAFEGERGRYRERLGDTLRRLASYRAHGDGGAFAGELADKRRRLLAIDEALALDIENSADPDGSGPKGAPAALRPISNDHLGRGAAGPSVVLARRICGDVCLKVAPYFSRRRQPHRTRREHDVK